MFNLNKNNMPYKNYEQSDNTRVQPLIQQKNLGEYTPTESKKNNMPGLNIVRSYTPEELARKKRIRRTMEKRRKNI